MKSLLELVREEQFEERPVTLRKLLQSHNTNELSAKALFASHEMLTEYNKSPRWILSLGPIVNGIMKDDSGSYRIPAQLGFLIKPLTEDPAGPAHGPPEARGEFTAAVDLAAIQCIGTEDPGNLGPNEDEVYGVISLFSLLPGTEEEVITKQIGVQKNVKAGDVIFKNTAIGQVPLISGANGFKIHTLLYDEEVAGPPDEAPENVKKAIQKGLVGVAAVAGAITARYPNPYTAAVAAGASGTALLLETGFFSDIMSPLHDLIALIFEDDKIGEKTFKVTPAQVELWSTDEGYNSSLKRIPETLGSDVSFNIPEDSNNPSFLFNEGGSTYKVFFNVTARKVDPFPIDRG